MSKIQQTSPDFIGQRSEILLFQLRGMRNVAILGIFVDLKIVSTTIKGDLPKLKWRIDIFKR